MKEEKYIFPCLQPPTSIYIAGHRGLVGSATVRMLQSKGYTNIITRSSREVDLRRQADVEAFLGKERPEYIFLAAAKVGGIVANSTYTAEFIYDNIMIAANIIHSAYKTGVKKLLNLGSSCIYPRSAPQPMKEEYLLTGPLEPTNEPYAIAKISAIKLCRYYNEQYGTNFISAMPTNLYGPNDNFDILNSHVLPALIRKFHLAKLLQDCDFEGIKKDFITCGNDNVVINGRKIKIDNNTSEEDIILVLSYFGIKHYSSLSTVVEIWGSGEPYREFLYVDDLADACVFLMYNHDYKDIGEFINIGAGEDIKIKNLAIMIKDIIGFEGEIRHDLSKPDGTPRKLLDISRIKALGWKPKIDLEEGIRKMYEWYVEKQILSQPN
ncbi:MAG: GDP-L-fucose synthase [Syntrophomonadaceae bacterium]|nr:GDP-L-fucose synthase [Bacillota bacterium]